jgi:hypothetical protein
LGGGSGGGGDGELSFVLVMAVAAPSTYQCKRIILRRQVALPCVNRTTYNSTLSIKKQLLT